MESAGLEPDGPGTLDPVIPRDPRPVRIVSGAQAGHVVPDGSVEGLEEGGDHRVWRSAEVLQGLQTAAHRLVDRLMLVDVKGCQGRGEVGQEGLQVRPAGRCLKGLGADEARIVVQDGREGIPTGPGGGGGPAQQGLVVG